MSKFKVQSLKKQWLKANSQKLIKSTSNSCVFLPHYELCVFEFGDIMNAIQQVEQYIQEVIDINLNNKQINTNLEEVTVKDFLGMLETEVKSLSNNIIVEDFTDKGTSLFIDTNLVIRALNNIVLNGIEKFGSSF